MLALLDMLHPKPPRGAFKAERDALKRERDKHEDEEKAKVRARFKTCRWPHCRHRRARLEVAHLTPKGHGGDPEGIRTRAEKMALLCFWHHQADPQEGHPEGSLERHNLRIVPLTDLGSFGPCVFLREHLRVTADGLVQEWIEVAREIAPERFQ